MVFSPLKYGRRWNHSSAYFNTIFAVYFEHRFSQESASGNIKNIATVKIAKYFTMHVYEMHINVPYCMENVIIMPPV